MTTLESSLRETIFELPIIDTHMHLWSRSDLPGRVTGYDFFHMCSYIRGDWASAGYFTDDDLVRGRRIEDWPALSEGIRLVRNIAFYRILWNGLKDLYEIDSDELDERSFGELSEKLKSAYSDPDWYRIVLKDRTRLDVMCQDMGWPGHIDRSLLTPTPRMGGRPGFANSIIQKHGEDNTSTIEGLEDCLRRDFEAAVEDGAAAIKSRDVGGRSLQYDAVTKDEAAKALAEIRTGPGDPEAEKVLGDYLMDSIAKLCAEFDLPLQIHTGPCGGIGRVTHYGNPLDLNSLLRRNPDTKFDLLHAGGPFINESCVIATQFPKVTLNLVGIYSDKLLRRILDEWIEFVPHQKFLWGTDATLVEEAYAITRSFRQTLWEFLSDRVRSGYLSTTTAEEFARGILQDNAMRTLRLSS